MLVGLRLRPAAVGGGAAVAGRAPLREEALGVLWTQAGLGRDQDPGPHPVLLLPQPAAELRLLPRRLRSGCNSVGVLRCAWLLS